MLNENAQKWLADLRSGNYPQTKSVLAMADGSGYCCLGVACETAILNGLELEKTIEVTGSGKVWRYGPAHSDAFYLPEPVINWLGLKDHKGEYRDSSGFIRDLATLNDTGDTFEEIADFIEEHAEALFKQEESVT